jgi:hypothetical protein
VQFPFPEHTLGLFEFKPLHIKREQSLPLNYSNFLNIKKLINIIYIIIPVDELLHTQVFGNIHNPLFFNIYLLPTTNRWIT